MLLKVLCTWKWAFQGKPVRKKDALETRKQWASSLYDINQLVAAEVANICILLRVVPGALVARSMRSDG